MGDLVNIESKKREHSLSYCPLCKEELIEHLVCSNPECEFIIHEMDLSLSRRCVKSHEMSNLPDGG